jgi:hypothetical protein
MRVLSRVNIIQAEFFHVGGEEEIFTSVGDVMDEIEERQRDGSRIKTVVRFFDEDGTITDLALLINKEETKDTLIRENFLSFGWFGRKMASIKLQKLSRKIFLMREMHKILIINKIRFAIKNLRQIAVEDRDHIFRMIEPNEKYELIVSIEASKSLWVFIFEPNHILAEVNEEVVNVM